MTRVEPRSAAVLTAIGIAHLVVIALLLTALVKSGVLSSSRDVTVFDVAAVPELPAVAEPSKQIEILADVSPPDVDVIESVEQPAVASGYDPFGGAALRSSSAAARVPPPTGQASTNALTTVESVEELAWRAELKSRLRKLQQLLGIELAPAVIEVLAQPAGGFTGIRILSKTGSEEADQQVIEAVMAQQALVPPGQVATPSWIALPAISVEDIAINR